MQRDICPICGKEVEPYSECRHYDFLDFLLELELVSLALAVEQNETSFDFNSLADYTIDEDPYPAYPISEAAARKPAAYSPAAGWSAAARAALTDTISSPSANPVLTAPFMEPNPDEQSADEEDRSLPFLHRFGYLRNNADPRYAPLFLRL